MASGDNSLSEDFKVTIGSYDFDFETFSGEMVGVETVVVNDGGKYPAYVRGELKAGEISFSMSLGVIPQANVDWLYSWFLDVCDPSKPLKKELIKVEVTANTFGKEEAKSKGTLLEYHFLNAWPNSWSAPSMSRNNGAVIENVSFCYEGIFKRVIPSGN